MHTLSGKILTVALVLLLILATMQSAMAGLFNSVEQPGDVHSVVDLYEAIGLDASPTSDSSGPCANHVASLAHSCSSGHCASCALVIIPTSISRIISTSERLGISLQDRLSSRPLNPLFRPPKT